jgi:para-nitrobenzyl esterase
MWKKSLICITLIMAFFVVSIQSAECGKKNKKNGLIRETAYGLVKGYMHSKNTYAWLGIPFAKPPEGDLRWKAPRPPEPWSGVRDATDPDRCEPCTQVETDMWNTVYEEPGKPSIIGEEDCLYLNIFAHKSAKKRPVYVYIHGGSNRTGAAANYNVARLAEKKNIVFVAVSYRLGPLGWFYHPAAQMNGNDADDSGNYGHLDNIQALKWIQENIAAFGGDPDNVTIAGESAGAHDVTVLLASPLAKGLFHQAHIESTGMENNPYGELTHTPEWARGLADNMLKGLLVLDGSAPDMEAAAVVLAGMSDEDIAAYAAPKTGEDIIRAMVLAGSPLYDAVVDGYVLPHDHTELFIKGEYNKVPVMLGVNEYEVKPFMRYWGPFYGPWDALFNDVLVDGVKTMNEVFLEYYGDAVTAEHGKNLYEISGYYGSLNWRAKHLDELATILAKQQDDVYGYLFKWGGVGSGPEPFDFIIGAGHAFEIPFWQGWDDSLFGLSFTDENEAGRKATQRAMMTYLARFAKKGNPNKGAGLTKWKPWSNEPGGPKALEIDADFDDVILTMGTETVTFDDVADGLAAALETLPEEMWALPYPPWTIPHLFQWYGPYVPHEH